MIKQVDEEHKINPLDQSVLRLKARMYNQDFFNAVLGNKEASKITL